MRYIIAILALAILFTLNPSAVDAKGKKTSPAKASAKAKKITGCKPGPGYQTCLNRVNGSVDDGQDRNIRRLESQVRRLKRAQGKAVKASQMKGALDRICELERVRQSLPEDLVGKSEIMVLIRDAAAANEAKVGKKMQELHSLLSGRIDNLEKRIDKLTERVEDVEDTVVDMEERIDTVEGNLYNRAISMELFGAGLASNGVLGGGVGGALVLPLGQTGKSFFRGAVWLGAAENGFGWGTQLSVDWWVTPWLAIGPSLVYSADAGKGAGVQSMVAGIGPDFRFKTGKFLFSLAPFIGVAGSKPYGKEEVGGGATAFIGVSL
ncbi:MAG: hypothetical protein HOD54_02010 [Candidatus Magasanikbacteria bacterium]|nr:hypothetical protein [Candidatus Magasanikbacteria bacterium]MBT4314847.1 hypothetical protein [Candidatus Magasanikbacteria bacterium]